MCPAPRGNQFWKARSKHGRDKIFKTPENLWDAAEEYFQWVEDNPLKEGRATQFQGVFIHGQVDKMRAMTITGLCRFLHVDYKTWELYKGYNDFIQIAQEIENVIKDQKFAGAAADLLNANIIARDLGLRDSQEKHHRGYVGIKEITDMSREELEAELNQ